MTMRRSSIGLLLFISGALLAGCGGSSGGSAPSTGVSVTPDGAQVLAGATQQMQATASDGGQSFTWQVNGTAGGNSTVGTISVSGLYTAPSRPPAGGTVTITATEQGGAGASGAAALNIAFSNASLSGAYVFTLGGRNQGTPWYAIGEFSANGAGQLLNGSEDVNSSSPVQFKTPINGKYSLNPDGSGTLTLGSLTFQLSMQANGGAVLLSSTSGAALSGSLSVQSASAGSAANLVAPLVLSCNGQAGNQAYAQLALIATVNSGALSGYEDVSGFNPALRTAWTGSFAFDGGGHGTLTIKDSTGNHTYSFYTVSATSFALLSTDPAVAAAGSLSSQAAMPYSNQTLTGPYVFSISGNSATQGFAQAGQFNPNGSGQLGTVTEDLNFPGNLKQDVTTVGTYTFDASVNGRGTLTLTNQGPGAPQSYVFYMLSPQLAEVITSNSSAVGSGFIAMQSANSPAQTSALKGAYAFSYGVNNGTTNSAVAAGLLSLDGKGTLGGKMLVNQNGSLSPTSSLSGSYALNSAVRGTATLISNGGAGTPFAIYPVTASKFILISNDPANAYSGLAMLSN